MDVRLYGHLVETTGRHRETVAYSATTGKGRKVIGPLLEDINKHEHDEVRPMISVVVVHKGTNDPRPRVHPVCEGPRGAQSGS